VGSVVDKVTMGQVLLRYSHVTTISPMLHTRILFIYKQRHIYSPQIPSVVK